MSESRQFCEYAWIIVVPMTQQLVHDLAQPAKVVPPARVCERARKSRDPRFEGRFIVGVVTTGVYCRPTCPAKIPAENNVRYFATPAGAQDAGFRPCRRCRPETALQLPEWTIGSHTVLRALRLIESGYLNTHNTGQLANEIKLSERHLSRLFNDELGATPKRMAQINRASTAARLLRDTALKHVDVAFHAGYGSVSRFNAEIREIYRCAPGALRKKSNLGAGSATLALPVRQPYDFDWIFGYLQTRALDGIERVSGTPGRWVYARQVEVGVWLTVRQHGDALIAELPLVKEPLHSLLRRVRRVFDLEADTATLADNLRRDKTVGKWVSRAPGLVVPGTWDGFELAVRAVLGQQVSVERGTELANKMIVAYGDGLFPTPVQLQNREIAELGMPGQRGRAIAELSRRVAVGELQIDDCQDYDNQQRLLEDVPGIGPWTANYIRMRALKDPDAFPDNDWVVMQQLECTAATARKMSVAWQPWRAYALMYIWFAAGQRRAKAKAARQSTKAGVKRQAR